MSAFDLISVFLRFIEVGSLFVTSLSALTIAYMLYKDGSGPR
jgi:hypothetical protein